MFLSIMFVSHTEIALVIISDSWKKSLKLKLEKQNGDLFFKGAVAFHRIFNSMVNRNKQKLVEAEG